MYVFIGVKYCGSLFPQKSNKKKGQKNVEESELQ